MKIGIDLDGVVFDSEKEFRVYSELYEVEVLKRNSIINSQEIAFQKRYKWTQEEIEDFLNRYHEKIVLESNFMPGAREVLNKLKKDGHELVVITARGGLNPKMVEVTKKKAKRYRNGYF